jgi:hypothetical protein
MNKAIRLDILPNALKACGGGTATTLWSGRGLAGHRLGALKTDCVKPTPGFTAKLASRQHWPSLVSLIRKEIPGSHSGLMFAKRAACVARDAFKTAIVAEA